LKRRLGTYLLGVHLPKKPGKMHVIEDLSVPKFALGRKNLNQLLDLSRNDRSFEIAAMRI